MIDIELFAIVKREEDLRSFRQAERSGVTYDPVVPQTRATWPNMDGWRAFFTRRQSDGIQLERPAYLE